VADAERARDEAYGRLDAALAAVGWNRVHGGFTAALYSHITSPGYLTSLEDVLKAVEFQRKAAA
jgi:hypothetical protein